MRIGRGSVVLLGSAVLALLGVFVWFASSGESTKVGAAQTGGAAPVSAPSAIGALERDAEVVTSDSVEVPEIAESSAEVAGEAPATQERVEAEATVSGQVLDATGSPVAGAQVSWTPARLANPGQVSSALSYEEWAEASALVETAADGHFELPSRVLSEAGALWATKVGFEPTGRLVGEDAEAEDWQLSMAKAEPLTISVVDAAGAAVPGAWVTIKASRGPSFGDLRKPSFYQKLQLFMRQVETDGEGLGQSAVPSLWLAAATEDSRVSPEVSGVGPGEVELVLGGGLTVSGMVHGEVSAAFVAVLLDHEDESNEALAVIPVLPDGMIVQTRIPQAKTGIYRFQLEGANLAPVVQRFAVEDVGEELKLAFEAQAARLLDFRFIDSLTHEPIAGVDAYSGWPRPDGMYLEVTQGSAQSDEDGLAQVPYPLEGYAYVVHSKDGYLWGSDGPFEGPIEGDDASLEPIEIALRPLGSVSGHVRLDGKPLHEFYVVQYEGDGYGAWQEKLYQDREDGTFLLEGLPAGPLHLLATSPGLAQSAPVPVDVVPGEVAEVELELGHGGVGRGRVLDARTMLPIPGAAVTRSLSNGERGIGAEPGVMVPVEADGSFELHGLASYSEVIGAFADGYGYGETSAVRGPGGDFDLGTVLLYPEGTMTLKVLLPDGIDPTTVYYYVSQSFFQGPGLLGPDGTVVVGGAKPGKVGIDLTMPSGEAVRFDRIMRGEGPWVETLDLSGGSALRVHVSGVEAEQLQSATLLVARLDDLLHGGCAQDRSQFAAGAEGDGVLFAGLGAGPHSIVLRSEAGALLGSMVTQLTGKDGVKELELAIEERPCAAHVVDRDGSPLAGVLVWVAGPGFGGFVGSSATDEDGVALLGNIPPGPALLCVNSQGGSTQEFSLDSVGPPDAPSELVYDPEAELLLTVTDRGVPLEGVMLLASAEVSNVLLPWMVVGTGGAWHQVHIGAGSYILRPVTPSVWYEEKVVSTNSTGTPTAVEFRRLGDLEVTVRDVAGKPAAGIPVDVRSVEFGTSVGDWLAAGRVKSSTGLVTDALGRVQIEGLPNGSYEVVAGAATVSGDVPALGTGKLGLTIAE